MSKRKKKKQQDYYFKPASTQLPIDLNKTIGSESMDEETSASSNDITSSTVLEDEKDEIVYPSTPSGLTDKYLLSGKHNLPIWRIAFLFLAAASMYIFVQDNGSGAFSRGDWWAIIWTIQKCLILSGFIFLLFVFHSLTNWFRKKVERK